MISNVHFNSSFICVKHSQPLNGNFCVPYGPKGYFTVSLGWLLKTWLAVFCKHYGEIVQYVIMSR